MWERFTQLAKKVASAVREEAALHGSDFVRTEHILLALCREPEGVAARALEAMGADVEAIIARLEQEIPSAPGKTSGNELSFTPRAKKVFQLASEEAMRHNHSYIGTEHILLGLLKEGEGIAAKVLQDMNIHPDRAEAAIMSVLGEKARGIKIRFESPKLLGKTLMLRFALEGHDESLAVSTATSQYGLQGGWTIGALSFQAQLAGSITPEEKDNAFLVECFGGLVVTDNGPGAGAPAKLDFTASALLHPGETNVIAERGELKLTLLLDLSLPQKCPQILPGDKPS